MFLPRPISVRNLLRFSKFRHGQKFRNQRLLINFSSIRSDFNKQIQPDTDHDADEVSPVLTPTQQSKPQLRLSNILSSKPGSSFTISHGVTVDRSIDHLVKNKLSASLVLNQEGEVAGIFTARDLLRFLAGGTEKSLLGKQNALTAPIEDVMTKSEKLVYCSPNDSVRRVREIMFQTKIRHVPCIDNGEVIGIITVNDLHDSAFSLTDIGGKKGFIHNVTGRKGLPEGTKLRNDNQKVAIQTKPTVKLDVDMASYLLPHPYKTSDGCASTRRNFGAYDLCNDNSLCEDAYFAVRFGSKDSSQVYMCVADGVGSWRQYGVDPRQFSHKLVENARKVLEMDAMYRQGLDQYPFTDGDLAGIMDQEPIHPLDVVVDAWTMTTTIDRVTGSSTICIATLDRKLGHLSYCNLGDCGLIVMRHIDSEKAGYMRSVLASNFSRERQLPRHLRTNDLRIAYLSQQQLRSFNLPYQLGYSDIPECPGNFETPSDADSASIPVMPGDIILLASDGLFDNLDLDEIVEICSKWENACDPNDMGEVALQRLAKKIVETAREVSLDKNRDSPFALLAKENDIMWGGGMPDDTTVVVARVRAIDDE